MILTKLLMNGCDIVPFNILAYYLIADMIFTRTNQRKTEKLHLRKKKQYYL